MAKFRRRPPGEIVAWEVVVANRRAFEDMSPREVKLGWTAESNGVGGLVLYELEVETRDGPQEAHLGDWVVRELDGTLAVYGPGLFGASFEPADDPAAPVRPAGGGHRCTKTSCGVCPENGQRCPWAREAGG